ncbi:MAG: PEP-CTERM sorting domain-containing protein [Fibrella sp.]|nr:PEP-CTERM sorting domain-containing protein [Armatimonadota bacterium]
MITGIPAAQADVFDFESLPPTYSPPTQPLADPDPPRPGAFTSLLLTGPTTSVSITRVGNQRFDLVSNTGDQIEKPPSYGNVSFDPFFTSNGEILLNFSTGVTDVSLDFGDYGEDTDSLVLSAFNGPGLTGAFLGNSFASLPGNITSEFTTSTISFSALGIHSIRLSSGSSDGFLNSIFLDNIVVSSAVTVPEANTLALLCVALPVIGTVAARRRKK